MFMFYIEVKSSISKGGVLEFWRVGKLYERVVGVGPTLVIISPYVEEAAEKVAEELKIRVYTSFRKLRQTK